MPFANELYYQLHEGCEAGERPPIILIHGAGGNYLHWHPNLRRISGQRIYALDLPGHGKSGGRGQQSIKGYTEAILSLMDEINLYKAVFAGHSMGSAIALDIILEHPKHVAGLILIGGGARLRVSPELLDATSSPTTYHQAIEKIISWSFSPNTSPQITLLAAERMAEIRPSVMHGDFMACNEFDVTEHLSRIYKPTLVLCGVEDKMMPVRYSQYLADHIPDAHLEIIPAASHMVILEQPSAVAGAISTFLDANIQ